MTEIEKLNKEQSILNKNQTYKLLKSRTGEIVPKDSTPSAIEGINDLSDLSSIYIYAIIFLSITCINQRILLQYLQN